MLEADPGANLVAVLRTALALHAVFSARGLDLSTAPHAAPSMGCSQNRAGKLLVEARGLAELPGAVEALECGLLTVEQSGVVVAQLAAPALEGRLAVWRRLRDRLVAEVDRGSVLPPARLAELLRRCVIEGDPGRADAGRARPVAVWTTGGTRTGWGICSPGRAAGP